LKNSTWSYRPPQHNDSSLYGLLFSSAMLPANAVMTDRKEFPALIVQTQFLILLKTRRVLGHRC
jgi:hypothetical protein